MNLIQKLEQKKWATIFVIYLRYLIGGAMVFSSIAKIKGNRFTTQDGILASIKSNLHFFETLYQSGIYWKFIGWSQLLAGMLVMTQLYAVLGAVIMFPITINIFVITISYYFAGTPAIAGLMLLANSFLILWSYERFTPLLTTNKSKRIFHLENIGKVESDTRWIYLGCLLFLFTVLYVVCFERTPLYWFASCVIFGIAGIILFVRKEWRSAIKKNHTISENIR